VENIPDRNPILPTIYECSIAIAVDKIINLKRAEYTVQCLEKLNN